jgi:hypothetical protein
MGQTATNRSRGENPKAKEKTESKRGAAAY